MRPSNPFYNLMLAIMLEVHYQQDMRYLKGSGITRQLWFYFNA